MMDFAETDELGKYKSYVQKRRVSPPVAENGDMKTEKEDDDVSSGSDFNSEIADPYAAWNKRETFPADHRKEEEKPGTIDYYAETGYPSRNRYSGTSLPAPRRADAGLYKKLYARSGKASSYVSPHNAYSGANAQIEDNKVTTLAVKLIKQALACFAILGIIVLMQSRPDMKDALAVVKKQVVEINYDPQSIFDGIKDVFNQITAAFGGSQQKE